MRAPYGRVPTLEEDGFALFESTAVLNYLEATRSPVRCLSSIATCFSISALAPLFHFSFGRKRLGNTMVPAWRVSSRSHSFMCMSTSARPRASESAS
jgi:hypothetical protein